MLKKAPSFKISLHVIPLILLILSCNNRTNSNETKIPKNIARVNIYESINDNDEFLLFEQYYEHGKIIREEQFGVPGTNYHSSKLFHYNKLNLLVKEVNTQTSNGTKKVITSTFTYNSKGKMIKKMIVQAIDCTISTFQYNENGLLAEIRTQSNNSVLGEEIFRYEYDKNDSISSCRHFVNESLYEDKYLRKGNKVVHKFYASGEIMDQTTNIYKNGVIVYSIHQIKEQIGTSKFERKLQNKYIGNNIIETVAEEHYSTSGPKGDKIVYRYEYY